MTNPDIWAESLFPSFFNYIMMGFYLMVMFIWASHVKNKNIHNPAYVFYVPGLFARVMGAIALCLVYTLYYDGGDTTGFFISSKALVNLLHHDPAAYFKILFGDMSSEAFSTFSISTGYPGYTRDISSFNIIRYLSIFSFLRFKDYFTSSILFAWFFFTGYWKLYLLLTDLYPRYYKAFAFSVLFFPSVLFWGSGILKDTVALSMTGWFLYAFYNAFIQRYKVLPNLLAAIFTGYLIIAIKAYILVALLPGVLIWLGWSYIRKLKNNVIRLISAPIVTLFFLGIGIGLIGLFGGFLGEYGSVEGILTKAIVTYEDHTRAVEYGQNYYDLGEFDGTLPNFLSKGPAAIAAGLFRPFIWEVRNPVMLMAALENLAFMLMILYIIWRTGLVKTIQVAFDEPLVVFALSFALVFAFAVGVSSANFGALVRLKIPLIPFLSAALFILFNRSQEIKDVMADDPQKTITTQLS